MRKLLASAVLALVLLASPVQILALETPGSGRGASATAKAQGQERRATAEARVALVRRERIRAFWGRMITRMEAAVARLEILIARMERRIEIIKGSDEDIDTTQPEKDIAEAKDLLEDTKAELESAKDDIEEVISNPDPKAAFQEVIDTVQGIKKNLVEIHRLLVHAIGEIRGLRVGTPSASPTATP